MSNGNKNPSAWEIIHEYTKTIITLSTAILAFTITFSEKLTGSNPVASIKWLIGITWSLLVLAIIFGLLSAASLSNHLRKKQESKTCILHANISFFLLVFAGILFVIIGLTQTGNKKSLSDRILKTKNELVSIYGFENGLRLKSLDWDSNTKVYSIKYSNEKENCILSVKLDQKLNHIINISEETRKEMK